MKVLIQRVKKAEVTVDSQSIGAISQGLLAFIGIEKHDDQHLLDKMLHKLLNYRVFPDDSGKMNLSVSDIQGGILAISQFTIAADTQKGLRPSFSSAAAPEHALALYTYFIEQLFLRHTSVATGEFAADMQVSLINDGPVTFMLEVHH